MKKNTWAIVGKSIQFQCRTTREGNESKGNDYEAIMNDASLVAVNTKMTPIRGIFPFKWQPLLAIFVHRLPSLVFAVSVRCSGQYVSVQSGKKVAVRAGL